MPTDMFEIETPDVELYKNRTAGDDKLVVMFYQGVMKNEAESAKEGRAIFDNVDFIKIFLPGDRNNIVERPVSADDKVRFAEKYKRYKESKESEEGSGTPLAEWPIITRSMAEELRYLGFRTVTLSVNVSHI